MEVSFPAECPGFAIGGRKDAGTSDLDVPFQPSGKNYSKRHSRESRNPVSPKLEFRFRGNDIPKYGDVSI